MNRKIFGLDRFDVIIHMGVTGALAVALDSLAGRDSEWGIGLLIAASLVVLAWRRRRALGSSAGGTSGPGDGDTERMAELEQRVAEVEALRGRLVELEERVDFAERLLTRQADAARVQGGGDG
ncbi:MAG TPA: hypothetical protein VH879_07980 [Gemmatimonadales bacterium]|jgi:hypothetical protein